MLTTSADGRSLKRSRSKVNGIILLETSTPQALRRRRLNRYLLNRRHPSIANLQILAMLITYNFDMQLIFQQNGSLVKSSSHVFSSVPARSYSVHVTWSKVQPSTYGTSTECDQISIRPIYDFSFPSLNKNFEPINLVEIENRHLIPNADRNGLPAFK